MLLFYLLLITCIVNSVAYGNIPEFAERVNKGELENSRIDEASGIISSSINPGVLWIHNDSGGKNRIFAVGENGQNLGEYYLADAENRDWEDIAVGKDPADGISYIYIGDIGDNNSAYDTKRIYRVPEPAININILNVVDTIKEVDRISFRYPDGARDAETLLYDPVSNDLFILGKRDSDIRLYRIAYPFNFSSTFDAEISEVLNFTSDPEQNIPNNYITGGDISTDGKEIILKTYSQILYLERNISETVGYALSNSELSELPFRKSIDEVQGEAVCWNSSNNRGYFTVSEERVFVSGTEFNFPAQLYYYSRITPVDVNDDKLEGKYVLKNNFPNPFNPSTIIEYELQHAQFVEMTVFDIKGEKIITLFKEYQLPGNYKVEFDTSDIEYHLSSGIYYYSIKYGGTSETKPMVLLK